MIQLQKMKQVSKKQEERFCGGNYLLIPLLIIIGIVPLIMRGYIYNTGLEKYAWYRDGGKQIDLFLRNKAVVICAASLLMALILVVLVVKSRTRFVDAYWIIPLVTYAVLTVLSTLFSADREFGLRGMHGQFETVWVILSYCVITVYAYAVTKTDNDIRVIRKALFFVLLILGFIGISQMIGHDFFATDLGRDLITPDKYGELKDSLTFNFAGSGNHQVYLTFYNPNYVGVFGALILPVTVMLAVGATTVCKKVAWSVITLVTFLCVLGCGSKTFILSLAVSAVAAVIFCRKILLRHYKVFLGGIILCIVCGTVYFNMVNVDLFSYMKNALLLRPNDYAFENMVLYDDYAEIVYKGNTLHIQTEQSEADNTTHLKFTDGEGKTLQGTVDEGGKIVIKDDRFTGLTFVAGPSSAPLDSIVKITEGGHEFSFASNKDGYYYVNGQGKVDMIAYPETALFTNYCSFASGRGYIWSRTIPLLKDCLLLGTGADTYTVAFPQNDYIGRTNVGYANLILTKPHNLYLQIGVQHGVLALVCFLAVCVMYLLQSFKLYWKAVLTDGDNLLGIGIMMGILGYLFSGISNDSCVALAPLFWVLLGVGFAVNRKILKEKIVGRV